MKTKTKRSRLGQALGSNRPGALRKHAKEACSWDVPVPSVLAMAVLLLALGTVATTPLAYAKYVATATFEASARVAKFEPVWRLLYTFSQIPSQAVPGIDRLSFVSNLDGGGLVIHPGDWCAGASASQPQGRYFLTNWRCYNRSEVLINARYRLMSYWDLDDTATHGGYSVGNYVHATRTELDPATNFGGYVGTAGGGWLPAVLTDWGGEPQMWSKSGVNVAIGGVSYTQSHYAFRGYNAQPARPTGSEGGTTTITKAAPIRYGVGSNTITGMNTKWWRTYRVNIDLVAVQVD